MRFVGLEAEPVDTGSGPPEGGATRSTALAARRRCLSSPQPQPVPRAAPPDPPPAIAVASYRHPPPRQRPLMLGDEERQERIIRGEEERERG